MQEMQDRRVQSLGWEDPLEEETATHSSILAWEISWTEESGGPCICHGVTKSQTQLSTYACPLFPTVCAPSGVKSGCSSNVSPKLIWARQCLSETRPHILCSCLIPLFLLLFQNAHPSFFLGLKANAVGPVCDYSPEFSSS